MQLAVATKGTKMVQQTGVATMWFKQGQGCYGHKVFGRVQTRTTYQGGKGVTRWLAYTNDGTRVGDTYPSQQKAKAAVEAHHDINARDIVVQMLMGRCQPEDNDVSHLSDNPLVQDYYKLVVTAILDDLADRVSSPQYKGYQGRMGVIQGADDDGTE